MASINKNFVIKNGLEVDSKTLYVDANTNRVGIGSTIPTRDFDVVGDATVQGSISASGNLTVDTNTFFVDATNNKVGVGTSSSLIGKLDVVGSPTTNTSTDVLVVSRPYNAGFGFHSAASFKLSNLSGNVPTGT